MGGRKLMGCVASVVDAVMTIIGSSTAAMEAVSCERAGKPPLRCCCSCANGARDAGSPYAASILCVLAARGATPLAADAEVDVVDGGIGGGGEEVLIGIIYR